MGDVSGTLIMSEMTIKNVVMKPWNGFTEEKV